MPLQTTAAVQDYLKALCLLDEREEGASASTTEIAGRLGVSAASATSMLKRLDGLGLVAYAPYRGAVLTEQGRRLGLEVIRHHRLLETYLAEALGVPWDRVHDEAEVLEHVLSEELEERISAHLGHPTADPHGDPIPTKDLTMPEARGHRLWDAVDGDAVTLERVSDRPDALRYLTDRGIGLGCRLHVVERGPIGGPLFVRVEDGTEVHALSKELAEVIWVR